MDKLESEIQSLEQILIGEHRSLHHMLHIVKKSIHDLEKNPVEGQHHLSEELQELDSNWKQADSLRQKLVLVLQQFYADLDKLLPNLPEKEKKHLEHSIEDFQKKANVLLNRLNQLESETNEVEAFANKPSAVNKELSELSKELALVVEAIRKTHDTEKGMGAVENRLPHH